MSHEEEKGSKKGHGGGHSHGPPHGGAHEEHEGAPEWLISFADNVTLMMGFFVILLAMTLSRATPGGGGEAQGAASTQQPNSAVLDVAIAIREAFNNPVDLGSSDPHDLPLIQRIHERGGVSEATQEGQKGRDHDVRSIRQGKYFRTGGTIEFEHGSSDVSNHSQEDLADLARQLGGHNLVIEVRGNVSSAEAFECPDRGVRLSFERAFAVAEAFVAAGLRWGQLRITACADSDRLVPLAYEVSAHRVNQRVEIVVTDQRAQDSSNEAEKPAAEETP